MASRSDYQLLTNCAACAAPLAHTAPRCVRCFTRYCKSVEILEDLVDDSVRVRGEDHEYTRLTLDILWKVRDEQLDWSIDDLTPETRLAYDFDSQFKYSAESKEDADGAATAS